MNDVPDWLWRELAGNAVWQVIWAIITAAALWVWKYQKRRTNNREPVLLSGEIAGRGEFAGTLTVGSERQILYNVEAPTPSLARRLEELASWYLHVS
jgi:hypothetical protein